jgi:hypothetical protein
MAFIIPNKTDAVYPLQSRIYATHFQVLNAAGAGTFLAAGAYTPLSITANGGMNIARSFYGPVSILNRVSWVFANTDVIVTSDSTYDQWILIYIDNSFLFATRYGVPSPSPEMPSIATDECCLASVYVPAGTTTITPDMILEFSAPLPPDLTPFMRTFTDTTNLSVDGLPASQVFRQNIGLARQSAGGFQAIGAGSEGQPQDAVVHPNTGNVYVMCADTTFKRWNLAGGWMTLATPPANASQLVIDYGADGGIGFVYGLVDGGVDLWRYSIDDDSWVQMASHPGATMLGCTMGACTNFIIVAGCSEVQTDSKKIRYYNVTDDEWFTEALEFSSTYGGLTLSKDPGNINVQITGANNVVTGQNIALNAYYIPDTTLNEYTGVDSSIGFPVVGGKWVGGANNYSILWNGLILVNDD